MPDGEGLSAYLLPFLLVVGGNKCLNFTFLTMFKCPFLGIVKFCEVPFTALLLLLDAGRGCSYNNVGCYKLSTKLSWRRRQSLVEGG